MKLMFRDSCPGPLLLTLILVAGVGCRKEVLVPPAPPPLGYASDPIWKIQESNAEASDFVIYEHEFEESDGVTLNTAGEDHVKQIAQRAFAGFQYPIIIQRSSMSVDPDDKYEYPVHSNPELDRRRREVVVAALAEMGVEDAEQRVVVAPALAPGFEGFEAERAYRSFGRGTFFGNGFGFGALGFGRGGAGGIGFF